MQWSSRRYD